MTQQTANKTTGQPVQADRWLEIDLFFFQSERLQENVAAVVERFAPLWQDVQGDRGLILCCGWLCTLVTEWTGDAGQTLPFKSKTAARWSDRSYADIRKLVRLLKAAAVKAGIADLKVGIMMVAWGDFSWGEGGGYDLRSAWYGRHPEIYFSDHWKNLDYRQRLKRDDYPYASLPGGIPEGMAFRDFFSGQWSLVSRFLELDAIHFRDGFLGRAIYENLGPFGQKGPEDPLDGEAWGRELLAFFQAAKNANPGCLVMVYSSARSAVGEYRVGCFDLATLVASGSIDVWIDQTWAGAWQDWWTQEFRGWTFQLANLIAHHVMISAGNAGRKTPCRHYFLTEIWDAWEPWDTLHQVPGKLRWGMWAFSHVAVATATGLDRMAGSYLGWASNWEGKLASPGDVEFLRGNLNAATANANATEEIYGPALALNLPQMSAIQRSLPAINAGDLIDDECAMLIKWGLPCLSGVNLAEQPVEAQGYILQTPAALSSAWLDHLLKPETSFIAAGPAQFVHATLLADIGVEDTGEAFKFGKQKLESTPLVPDEQPPPSVSILAPGHRLEPGTAEVIAQTSKTVLIAQAPGRSHFVWQPPSPFVPWVSYLGRGQYGSLAPFVAMVRAWQRATKGRHSVTVNDVPFHLPMAFHLWRSAGKIFVLAGNLETGITGDSRSPREISFTLHKNHLHLSAYHHILQNLDDMNIVKPVSENAEDITFRLHIAPQDSVIYQLADTPDE